MTSLKDISSRLRELGLENEYRYRAETRRIPECLEGSETLRAITSGIRGGKRWLLLLTEHRLLLLTKPTMGSPDLIAIDRTRIRNVSAEKGLFFGTVTIITETDTYTFTNALKKSLPTFLAACTGTDI
jgi:hypothetical protein